MNHRRWIFSFFAVLALLLAVHLADAQVLTGTLTGTVTDPTDAVVPNALVSVTDLGSGRTYEARTNAEGVYTFTNLPNSSYKVVVEFSGFSRTEVTNVRVDVSQTSRINVKLEIAKTGSEVVVQAEQTAVQSDSAELKNTVDAAQLGSMPLPTRNPLDLVKTFAGILTPNTTSVTGGDAFVHGLRGNDTNLTQDGINVQDSTVKTSAFFALSAPVADTIEEINVSVGGIGTDGGFGAAQVSMVTKRGTNDYHGSVYWYQRTSFLNANTWFNNATGVKRPFQLQNHIGTTIGGPASIPKLYNAKNRTFFFFAYEAYREPRAQPRERTVMTPSAEQGLFTYTPSGASPVTVNLLNIGTIGNTGLKPVLNPTLSALYSKIVPQSGLTDAGCGSGDGVNIRCYAFNLSGVNNQDRYTVRMDQQLGQRNAIQFIWNRANYNTTPDLLNGIEPQFVGSPFSGGQVSAREDFVGAWTTTISPTMTNEVRIGVTHAPVSFAYGYNFSDTGGNQVLYSTATSPILTSTNLPQGRNSPVQQYMDNFAWVKGTHQMRFGGEYRRNLATSYLYNTVFPRTTLGVNAANPDNLSSATLPGISAAELTLANSVFVNDVGLLGSISQGFNHTSPTSGYVPNVPEQYTPIQQNFAAYVQDSWKVRRNLTLQYGVRWEYQGPYDARNGLVLLPQNNLSSLFGPTPISGVPVANLFQPGNVNSATDTILTLQGGSNGHPVTNRDLNNFGPFIGIAYTPFADGKTVIRAHFAQHFVQDGFTFYTPATTANTGLFSTFSNSTPTGVFANTGLPLPTPTPGTGGFPVSQLANWINSGGTANLVNYDPHLVTPYVLDWGFGLQRELWKKYTIETRYVGNHAVKQYRSWSVNELNLNTNGLVQEFNNAQNNYNIDKSNGLSGTFAYNNLPGQVPTAILDKLFAGVANSAAYGSSGFITNLTQNNIYSMFNTIRTSPTYRTNVMGAAGTGAANGLPLNFFVANPWAAAASQVNNAGWSYYDGLEVEVKRQYSNGFFLLANYSFSKVLADTTFAASQTEGQNYQSLQNTRLDKFVSAINVRHSFGMTTSYPLPFGRGKKFASGVNRLTDSIIGGWVVSGFTHWSTGAPLTISSARLTTGSGIAQTPVLMNVTTQQLQNNIGVYRTGSGVYFINPQLGLFTIKGSTSTANFCTAGQTTPCFAIPAPGQPGNLPYNGFSGPHFFDQDFSIAKDTQIFERLRFHLALEAFDVFNNANFAGPTTSTDSTTFGQLTTTFDTARGGGVTSRIVQWTIKLIF
ncbi:MAG TPA: carboxypeptidase regulatory-like domain-containing protein [Bryobacteraceae bacterium]|nr:carboxypeptidase regulatory-like domain-containing protein [Bryobacteraceae bacterium]